MGNVPLPATATTVADDATAEVELLVSTAQKQLDLFRAQVTDIRGKDSPLKHTEVTGGRTLRYKVDTTKLTELALRRLGNILTTYQSTNVSRCKG